MNDRTFTAGDGTSGTFQAEMYRRAADGAITLYEVDFADYVHPPRGARGRFELHGWSPFYETQSTFNGETKAVTRMRAEYKILKLPGNTDLEGRLFAQQFPVPKHIDNEKSKLGQFLKALLNRDFVPGEPVNPDDFLGTEFVTSVTRDEVGDRVYCGISWDVIDPSKTKLSPYLGNGAAQPEPVAVPAGGSADDAENPFDFDESDL